MSSTVLEIRRLALAAGERMLVRDLSIQVQASERWVLIGPNGAGKSTLLAAMAGARTPQDGSILVADRPMVGWKVRQLAAQRAMVNDRWIDPFAATVIETVLTARYRFGADEEQRETAMVALAEMDCAHLADRDVRGLSRGERQRVAISTALAQQTPILLLDEPTSHTSPGCCSVSRPVKPKRLWQCCTISMQRRALRRTCCCCPAMEAGRPGRAGKY
jgi:iron complex transport system ATP-binding protein